MAGVDRSAAAAADAATAAAAARRVMAEEVERIEAATAALRSEHDRWRAAAGRRRTAWEAAARNGTFGPGAQTLQERVDAGLTSWVDVLDGRDPAAAAHEARGHVRRRVAELGRERTEQ